MNINPAAAPSATRGKNSRRSAPLLGQTDYREFEQARNTRKG
jgi:hypothetical protein